jgi:hypothetical protein
MWKQWLALGAVWVAAAGQAAAQFDAPIYDVPQLPPSAGVPQPPPQPPPPPVIDRAEGTPFQMMGGPGRRHPYAPAGPDDPMSDVYPDLFGPPHGPPWGVWTSVEFLYWATSGANVPPLVTTGPAALGTGAAGFLGQPGTVVLFGGTKMLTQMRPGFRFEIGSYLGESKTWGGALRYYNLGAAAEQLVGGSDGSTVVNVPQFIPVNGVPAQFATYVGFPGTTFGAVSSSVHTDFQGGDAVLRRRVWSGDGVQVAALAGYRFMHLGDTLNTVFFSNSVGFAPGTTPSTQGEDSYRTRNRFHGLDVGLVGGGRSGCWSWEMTGRMAMGATVAELDASRTRTTAVGTVLVTPALAAAAAASASAATGLAVPTPNPNVQTATTERTSYFAVVPEVGTKVGWHPYENLRVTVGYSFLYWSQVRRAQEQYVLGPTPAHTSTGMWVQGVNLGLELRY